MSWINGKKTAIAATLNAVLIWVTINNWIDDNTAVMIASILTAWTGISVGHKIQKGELK